MPEVRSVKLRSYAKINLDLRVLHKRTDGFHALRTIFQTISLHDTIELQYRAAKQLSVEINSDIPDNLIVRAIHAFCTAHSIGGAFTVQLRKRIPMGGGLGGGSSNAASTLLALPGLTKRRTEARVLSEVAAQLGSDVPFFLYGGTAVGLDRGTELYPLPDLPELPGVLVLPGVHVATGPAYQALQRGLTESDYSPTINTFGAVVWSLTSGAPEWPDCRNDFEEAVYKQHPALAGIHQRLTGMKGAKPLLVRMSGSGSTLFALHRTKEEAARAASGLGDLQTVPVTLVSRKRYQSQWFRSLSDYVVKGVWPPQPGRSR